MKIPLQLKCPDCGSPRTQQVHLNDPSVDFTCAKCGRACWGIPELDVTVGVLILARSWHELEIEKDYDMAIVLAATAFDCELSRLYCKWKQIEALGAGTDFNADSCDEDLRRMGGMADKINAVSGMMCEGGIEQLVARSDTLRNKIDKRFPSLHRGSLASDFQKAVFWPRNKVLHRGDASHTREEAARCYSIARLGIHILKDMDQAKRSAADL